MKRKVLIVFILVVIFILLIAGVFALISKNKSDDAAEEYVTTNVETSGLDAALEKIPGVEQETVNTSIMGIIRKNIASPKESYAANYRQNSFTQSQTASGIPLSTFLVDIPEIERTFLVKVEGSQQTASMTIYTLCPLPGQSIYGEKSCNDTP